MTATLGHTTVVSFSSAFGGSYVAAAGIDSASLNDEIDLLDVTSFADSTARKRVAGLRDWTLDVSGRFEVDATSQGLLRSLGRTGAAIFGKFLYDGTNGYAFITSGGGGLVKSWKVDSKTAGTVDFSATIVGNQAIEVVGTPE